MTQATQLGVGHSARSAGYLGALAAALAMLWIAISFGGSTEASAAPAAFRLPFAGEACVDTTFTTHQNGSAHALDYSPCGPVPWNGQVLAAEAGTVVFAGEDKGRKDTEACPVNSARKLAFGHLVILRHPDGLYSYYAHLATPSPLRPTDRVLKGGYIGQMGDSGCADGKHLHFEVRRALSNELQSAVEISGWAGTPGVPVNGPVAEAGFAARWASAPSSTSQAPITLVVEVTSAPNALAFVNFTYAGPRDSEPWPVACAIVAGRSSRFSCALNPVGVREGETLLFSFDAWGADGMRTLAPAGVRTIMYRGLYVPSSTTSSTGGTGGGTDEGTSTPPATGSATHCVSGYVTGPSGPSSPVFGATVNIGTKSATTGSSGAYSICQLTAGGYKVIASANGYTLSPAYKDVTVGPSATQVNFLATAVSKHCISGYVTGSAGLSAPIWGVQLSLGSRSATTGGNGFYSICDLDAGTYRVIPAAEDYTFGPAYKEVTIGPDATGVNFVGLVAKRFCIAGYTTGPQGGANPIRGIGVGVVGPDSAQTVTGADGRYLVCGLREGDYTLRAYASNFNCGPDPRPVFLSGADRLQENFVCQGPPVIQWPSVAPISPADGGSVQANQEVVLEWTSVPGYRYMVKVFNCEYRLSAVLDTPRWGIGQYPAGTTCGWEVQLVDQYGTTGPGNGHWWFSVPAAPTMSTSIPVPYFYTESQAWVSTGVEFSVTSADASNGGRLAQITAEVHSTCGQPGGARLVETSTGEVLVEWELACPDTWRSASATIPTGTHQYRLEVHGHVGWSPNLHVVEGTITLTT